MMQHTLSLRQLGWLLTIAYVFGITPGLLPVSQAGEWMIVGIDRKIELTRQGLVKTEPGHDAVAVFQIGKEPAKPTLIAELPLMNSAFGPPTNLAITPDGTLALVANSVLWEKADATWEPAPDNRIHVVDLAKGRPVVLGTVQSGQQPSGLAISRDGKWAAVANRAGKSVSAFSITGSIVTPEDTIAIDGEAAAVAITPDAKRILVTKFAEHSVAVIEHENGKLNYDSADDLPVGRWPYNVQITPNGELALVANNGNKGLPDGHLDTLSVVDLAAEPPRVIDHVVVGDGLEGLAISPDGSLAAVPLMQGSAPLFEGQWFFKRTGSVAIVSIDGSRVRKTGEVEVGRLPEGVGFSRDGRYIYVGDLMDDTISILKVNGAVVTHTGERIQLSGHPGSLRTQLP